MYKIQTLNTISASGLAHFPNHLYEIHNEIHQPDAILVRSTLMHDFSLLEN